MRAQEYVERIADSFDERDAGLLGTDPLAFEGYASQLATSKETSGVDEACVWGFADIDGQRAALVVFDFDFLGGSMGGAVGEKVSRAFEAARRARAPVVTVTASGGARMQEGMWSLVQMAKTVEARTRHAAAGLVHVTLLTSPTTGGVYASFASLADVIYAEPQATLGFAGPRVVEQLTGQAPPPDVHTAEFAYAHGLIDEIIPASQEKAIIARALSALAPRRGEGVRPDHPASDLADLADVDAWTALQLVRDPARPTGSQILDVLLRDAIGLRGDRTGARDDEHIDVRAGALAGSGRNVVAIAQDSSGDGRIRPQGFRKATRALGIAGRLGLPVLTLIDTPGADPLPDSEGGGVAVAISRTFEAMLACPSATLAVLTGEGGSGGALSLAVADRVLALSNAVFSVIAPEGAAAILYRDPSRASELASRLRITVPDLVDLGLVDGVIPEPEGGVQASPQVAIRDLARRIEAEVESLVAIRPRRRDIHRHRRWRDAGGSFVHGPKGR